MNASSTIRTTTYTWDFENRLSSVALPNNGGAVSFRYDPFGRRIQKTWPNSTNTSTTTMNYSYDGSKMTAELSSSGAVVASYAQGPGIDEPLAMQRGGNVVYYQADALGSITSLTSNSGATVATYVYDSFGNTTATEGIYNPFRYTGREQDQRTGLYYYRARYYDPTIGRFISEDPIGFSGGHNFYAYALNNPVRFTDPLGLAVEECQRPLGTNLVDSSHTLLYTTSSNTGFGLGPKNGLKGIASAWPGVKFQGTIEWEQPYDNKGKRKPGYQCNAVSTNQCVENCVNRKALEAAKNPPDYKLGWSQCDMWAHDQVSMCKEECHVQ